MWLLVALVLVAVYAEDRKLCMHLQAHNSTAAMQSAMHCCLASLFCIAKAICILYANSMRHSTAV